MRAHRLVAPQQPAELCTVPDPEPGPGEVLVRVGGAGLCHSDLHLMHWPIPVPEPFTLGHETAGWVEALGPGATGVEIGEPVIVHGAWGCGTCRRCRSDLEQYCETVAASGAPRGSGLGRDGGLADFLVVPSARHLVPLGDLDPRQWAPLDDAALTPCHALARVRHLCTPDNWALVLGIGGLGHAAVQLLTELTGVRVIAADVSDEKLAVASALGADATVRADAPDAAATVRDLTRGQGVAVVLDCVGVDASVQLATQVVHPVSHVVVVGIGMGTLPLSYASVPFETTVSTTFWGTVGELRELVALAAARRLTLHVEQIPLDDVAHGYERLAAGAVDGRLVAVPAG
jgi:propanol-preferring alcohol dehydrogenase